MESPRLSNPRRLFALLALVTSALYLPSFNRGWASEDFLILRRFHQALIERRFFATAWEHATGPWLDISLVAFYRPLASLFLQLEHWAFGIHSAPYWCLHLAVHLANCALVYGLLRRLSPEASDRVDMAPWAATAIFAFYPLHPNAVVFVASFATLWSVFFMLWSIRLFLDQRPRGSLITAGAALACYEQAAVLPGCLLVLDWLFPRPGATPHQLKTRIRTHVPYWLLTAGYLVTRQALLGHSIGGYGTFRSRLADPSALIASMVRNLGNLPVPDFASPQITSVAGIVMALFLCLAFYRTVIGCLSGIGDRPLDSSWRLALLGGLWILGSQAPFSFVGVVPGNARYWYFAAVGLAGTWLALATILSRAWQRIRARFAEVDQPSRSATDLGACAVLLLPIAAYGALLWQMNTLYGQAGAQTEAIRRLVVTSAPTAGPLFVAGAPAFLKYQQVNAAQVFHWGLADASMPPFSDSRIEVYPIPDLPAQSLSPLRQAFPGSVMAYRDGRLVALGSTSPTSPSNEPPPIDRPRQSAAPAATESFRLILLSRGHYWVGPYTTLGDRAQSALPLPGSWIDSMVELYDSSPIFWWLEYRTAHGESTRTELHQLPH